MGSEEDPRDYDDARKHFKIGYAIAGVSGTLMWLLMFIWVFNFNGGLSSEANSPINLHIILMIFFVLYLQGHAAIMFRMFPSKPKIQVKLIHAGIHIATVIAMIIGFWSALRYHGLKKSPNFYSLHSWIGLTAMVLYYGQFLAGFTIFLLPFAPARLRAMVIPYHKMLGPLIFISCGLAAATGIMMKALGSLGDRYPKLPGEALIINFAALALLIFIGAVITLVYEHRFRRRSRPEGEMLLSESEREQ